MFKNLYCNNTGLEKNGGSAPLPKILGGLQPPQPTRFLRLCNSYTSENHEFIWILSIALEFCTKKLTHLSNTICRSICKRWKTIAHLFRCFTNTLELCMKNFQYNNNISKSIILFIDHLEKISNIYHIILYSK